MMTINLQRKHLSLALLLTLATLISACGGDSNPEPTIEDTLYFVHTDHLGTPQVITDGDQNTVWEGRALPFGETDIITSQITFNVRFPGQYYDQESGLHYNYFRDYDPSIGRYVQSDPIGLGGGLNTYAYVSSNPLAFVDPLGLAKECKTIFEIPGLIRAEGCTDPTDETKKKGKQKREKRQIDDICKDYKIDRNEFGDFLEYEYKPDNGIRGGDTMSYSQLKDAAEQFLGM